MTALIFIIVLGVLILVHEFGHFIVAKKSGMKVEEFGFGYPPKAFGIKKGGTIYSFNWIPFGGFVKIFGKENGYSDAPGSFYAAPIYKRLAVILAGVAMNFLLGAVLLSIGFGIGLPSAIEDGSEAGASNFKIQISAVSKNSPAEKAGLAIGDEIMELWVVETEKIKPEKTDEVINFVAAHKGETVFLATKRGSEIREVFLTPRVDAPSGEGPMGVGLVKTGIIAYPWYKAIYLGFTFAASLIALIVAMFGQLIWTLVASGELMGEVAGPVGIYNLTGQAVEMGWAYVIQFAAFLTLNLTVINLLPLPALDGGQAIFLLLEKIRRKPISYKVEQAINTASFALLILLMVVVTFRDIIKLF